MYILFDCNNFFASCEQVFRPDWKNKPLVVLSNNDGCVVSRSAEAKGIGIAMGEPYFKCRERLAQYGGIACSGNFSLYQDLSERVMQILEAAFPDMQQYSIDEAFCRVDDAHDWTPFCRDLRHRITRWTGITVSVGIAPTRTLAKLANETAKKDKSTGGVLALDSPEKTLPFLLRTPAEDIWGVGRRTAPKLRGIGIRTAADIAAADLSRLNRLLGIQGERLALELRGRPCIDEEETETERTQIAVTRTLKEGVCDDGILRGLLCRFAEKAGRVLRQEQLFAGSVSILLRSSGSGQPHGAECYESKSCRMEHPTDDSRVLLHTASELLARTFRPSRSYRKLGIILTDLLPASAVQATFEHPSLGNSPLMAVLDNLQQAGHNIHFASAGVGKYWNSNYASPSYTTKWSDIPEAY